jgi:hypothetical protein
MLVDIHKIAKLLPKANYRNLQTLRLCVHSALRLWTHHTCESCVSRGTYGTLCVVENQKRYYGMHDGIRRPTLHSYSWSKCLASHAPSIEARYALRVEYAHRILQCSTACGGFGL